MTHYEMVELLREKANVSYEEAKDALEATSWDLLDAIVLLEREGKTQRAASDYSTKSEEAEEEQQPRKRSEFKENMGRLGDWLRKMIDIGNRNQFVLSRKDEEKLTLPVTAFAVIAFFTFPWSVIVLGASLFLGFRITFRGAQTERVNPVMDRAGAAAEKVRAEFEAGFREGEKSRDESHE